MNAILDQASLRKPSVDPATLDTALDRLGEVLAAERRAIVEHDVETLLRSTREKLDVLRSVEALVQQADVSDCKARISELAQANHANGALLARRRREVNWTLRHLGRSERSGAYDIHGQTSTLTASRALGVV